MARLAEGQFQKARALASGFFAVLLEEAERVVDMLCANADSAAAFVTAITNAHTIFSVKHQAYLVCRVPLPRFLSRRLRADNFNLL